MTTMMSFLFPDATGKGSSMSIPHIVKGMGELMDVRGDLSFQRCKLAINSVEFSDREDDEGVASNFSDIVTKMAQDMATRNFRPDSLLGEWEFGYVFKGWIEENGTAPVKSGTGGASGARNAWP
ncbi:hypothetical protein AgCh_022755 [Apium graveolens]